MICSSGLRVYDDELNTVQSLNLLKKNFVTFGPTATATIRQQPLTTKFCISELIFFVAGDQNQLSQSFHPFSNIHHVEQNSAVANILFQPTREMAKL